MNTKIEQFDKKINKSCLNKAFNEISNICFEIFGFYAEDAIEDGIDELEMPILRIRYEKDNSGERFVFETRKHDEVEYDFACRYEIINDMISFQALTQIREYIRCGYKTIFK